jgi:glutathione peroxidase-family protein
MIVSIQEYPSFILLFTVVILLVFTATGSGAIEIAADTNPTCNEWAVAGECEKNPGYMKSNCATSCHAVAAAAAKADEELESIQSFFDLQAPDIHGNIVKFEKFRDQVTILTNVASYCGYTESHYKGLVELWSQVKDRNINILAFPCNQFGKQEPGTADEIVEFARSKGVQFTIMSKVNVNGPDADTVYKYLKKSTNVSTITWNFATYFVAAPDGTVTAHKGVEPMDLLEFSIGLLGKEEL